MSGEVGGNERSCQIRGYGAEVKFAGGEVDSYWLRDYLIPTYYRKLPNESRCPPNHRTSPHHITNEFDQPWRILFRINQQS